MSSPATFKPFDILDLSKKLVVACYTLTGGLPPEEKTNLTHFIRNAALQVHLNAIDGAFLQKKKRKKKTIKAARNALVIIDASTDVLVEVGLVKEEATNEVRQLSSLCYQLLDRLKKQK